MNLQEMILFDGDVREDEKLQKLKLVLAELTQRINAKKEPFFRMLENGCWEWLRVRDKDGYGTICFQHKNLRVHRFFYEKIIGPIPEGFTLDHKCRFTACGNPCHLEPVSIGVNVLRGFNPCAENARKTHCKKGHPLSGENLRIGRVG